METVITRIFYDANRRHGKMSLADLRRSGFDRMLRKLENSDLNQTEDCFSYKHFYVIYCKFWELDQDHDLILDEQDLAGYSGGAISTRIIRRVMQGYGNETGMFTVPDQDLLLQQQHLLQEQAPQVADNVVGTSSEGPSTMNVENTTPSTLSDPAAAGTETVNIDNEGPKTLTRSESMTLSSIDLTQEISASPSMVTISSLVVEEVSSSVNPVGPVTSSTTLSTATTAPPRSGPPGPGSSCKPQNYRMTYKGFIWFLLAETDKQTITSIEYWFRCMDLDGDGMLTVFELEQLFQEQATRMAILGMESFGFRDAICQMQDLVGPKEIGLVRLSDLKQCGQAGPFIDLFCNVVRWRSFEAHQHQIRMRQQQIAMQRAADAAWEESGGEDLFDDEDDDEDEDNEDDDEDDDDDDDSEDDEDLDDEDDEMDIRGAHAKVARDNKVVEEEDSEEDAELLNKTSKGSTATTRTAAIISGNNKSQADLTAVQDEESQKPAAAGVRTIEQSLAAAKALKKRRAKEKRRRRRQAIMKRALLEDQRKEKALLATIR